MSESVRLIDSNVRFKKSLSNEILATLKDYTSKIKDTDFIDKKKVLGAKNIKDCFFGLRFDVDEDTDYYSIEKFNDYMLGDVIEKALGAIAKFIEKGMYLEFAVGNGGLFRLVFNGNNCEYVEPKIKWE